MKSLLVIFLSLFLLAACQNQNDDWSSYGKDLTNQRFSKLDQINIKNVKNLELGWQYQTGISATFQATPIVYKGIMYVSLPFNHVIALDGKTGKELWKQVGDNLYINHGLLDKVPNKHIIPIRKLIMPNYSPPPPNGILEYTYHNATETLDTIDELLKKASKNKKYYYRCINESARYIKEFYCNKDGTCPFIDPKVVVE